MKKLFKSIAIAGLAGILFSTGALAAGGNSKAPRDFNFSFKGMFGTYDRGALQRGFLVYKDVCAACHSLRLLSYRNLAEKGGPEFTAAQMKAIAASAEVTDGPNDEGEMFTRPGIPADRFVSPFPNDKAAAAANGGAVPPDLSLFAKQRAQGPEYIASLLAGYEAAPGGEERDGSFYNAYFAGHWLAMSPPLSDDGVEYADGTKATVEQQAKDVATFLMWAAEPKMEDRKRIGFIVLVFMSIFTVLLYLTKKAIWSDVKH